ncbi:MAG: DNA/RNA non-specific endonuclease [Acidobacteriota bacterium]
MTRQIDVLRSSTRFSRAMERARDRLMTADSGPGFSAMDAIDPDEALEVLGGSRNMETMSEASIDTFGALEAIVLAELRPPYLIRDDVIVIAGEFDHLDVLETHKANLEKVAKNVGRVDLLNHRTRRYAGTGWLIADDIVVTNRHVAQIFAQPNLFGGYEMRSGAFNERLRVEVDYVREHDTDGIDRRASVKEVLFIAGSGEPDIAFLRVATNGDVTPLVLETKPVEEGTVVAAIGYPASDGGRNDADLMAELFGDIYDVKRFAPGLVTGHLEDGTYVLSDYTSLGGNSGSPVIDLTTGKAIGLHFAGAFREANFAVAADIVAAALARQTIQVAVGDLPDVATEATPPETFAGRGGYDHGFLGTDEHCVPLPTLGAWATDVAPVSDDDDGILKYTHFSVIQSASRRLPLVTAVNIDGSKSIRLKRKGDFKLDGRIVDPDHQVGNELYKHNPLDRGHMVRRRDPGWGDTSEEAQQAEIDTFHYTNVAPQHKDLNQRDWLGLEDHILDAAETRDFKVSVFCGPVFRDSDRRLKRQPGAEKVQIPEEFWKIAVMVNADTGELSATGYVLSHGVLLRGLVEAAFVLGEYKTYQVRIALIEQATGLDFGSLRDHDPLGASIEEESIFNEVARPIAGPSDLKLS